MSQQIREPMKIELKIFFAIVGLTGLAMGMSDGVISNFFNDAYNVTTEERGFLELPRELPGVLLFLIIAFTAKLGDVRLAIIAQALLAIGGAILGLFTPSFAVMCFFIFTHSLGMHMFIPLQDSIGMSIIGKQDMGTRMGQYAGIRTAFAMLASIIIFIGFRADFFSFKTQIKLPFLIATVGFIGVFILFIVLYVKYKVHGQPRKKEFQILFRKEYISFYILAILVGVHRQIMVVYGPWVLIRILGQGADTMALLSFVGAFVGIFFLPAVGRWTDKLGPKVILFAEGVLFILVYVAFGYMSYGFSNGIIATVGIPVLLVFALYILERLTMQLNIVRNMYLRSIAVDPADITPTLSTGLSMDHVVSIVCAYLGGLVWVNFGSQYVFYGAAAFSIINVVVALRIKGPMIAPMVIKA